MSHKKKTVVMTLIFCVSVLLFPPLARSIGKSATINNIALLKNNSYLVKLVNSTDIEITHKDGKPKIFKADFTILQSSDDPKMLFRRGDIGYNNVTEEVLYNVATWGREELKKIDPNEHVMDGFNPQNDRGLEEGRTANYFLAAPNEKISASEAIFENDTIKWIFPENKNYSLTAQIKLPQGDVEPQLSFTFIPNKEAWYSVGYTGAPKVDPQDMTEMWQPMIWQEKRFPNLPYLTEASRCPLPSALVENDGVTVGVLADAAEIPFMPLPKLENSRFGIMVRGIDAKATPILFAPILGGIESKMLPEYNFTFKAHLVACPKSLIETYIYLARTQYKFADKHENATVTLNKTFENMIDYDMSPYSQFISELRGCNYATDVPGAVKNISGLHPLSLSVITDNADIYTERARPMIEYGLSRERFLFATNPAINRDGTSARLEGPGVPMSDFSTVYTFSQNRMNNYLEQAKQIYTKPVNRSLNLEAKLYGDRWQNAMYLYRATGETKYLDAAVKGADEYLAKRVYTKQVDFSDRDSRGMFFWTSYVPQWMELYLMYKTTGYKRYLDAAQDGARRFCQFSWFCPVVPDAKVLVNEGGKVPRYRIADTYKDMNVPEEIVDAWRVSEIGLTPESSPTCQGHRAIYLAQHAPWMMAIAEDANDNFLYDVARSAIIGRYQSFPGYHINAGRTTGHGKADFALRSLEELNGVTSLHYNHPWPHTAAIMDYLVTDVYYRSNAKIQFPAEYAEGYAYCRSQIYGAKPGIFYDEKNIYLYMPKGLASSSDVQINYLAARGNGKLYLVLTNQSKDDVTTKITLDAELAGISSAKTYDVKIFKDNKAAGSGKLENNQIKADVTANGITALAIEGVNIETKFQEKFLDSSATGWKIDRADMSFGNGTVAVLFNMGADIQSVYSYIKANGDVYKEVTLHYSNDSKWQKVTKDSYPFEFTVDVPKDTKEFRFKYEAVKLDEGIDTSEEGVLSR